MFENESFSSAVAAGAPTKLRFFLSLRLCVGVLS